MSYGLLWIEALVLALLYAAETAAWSCRHAKSRTALLAYSLGGILVLLLPLVALTAFSAMMRGSVIRFPNDFRALLRDCEQP